jgi:hypothetical protein
MKITKQPERPTTNIFIFASSKHAGLGEKIASDPLNRLDAGLFVNGNGVNAAVAVKFDRFAIGIANSDDLSVPGFLIVDLGKQPIPISMRLYIGSILKKRSRGYVKYSARCFA